MAVAFSKVSSCKLAKVFVPEYTKMLRDLQKGNGRFQLEPRMAEFYERIGPYVLLYEDEGKLNSAYLLGLLGEDEIVEFARKIQEVDEKDREQFINQFVEEVDEHGLPDIPWPETDEEIAKANEEFQRLTKDEQSAAVKRVTRLYGGAIASFFNCLSLMVHGAKLTSLVSAAVNGNEDAFVKAIQIDSRILRHYPYFVERKRKAQEVGESLFLRKLAYGETKPPLKGKIRYPGLYMLFGFLDAAQSLGEFTHSEILDLCDEIGLDRYQNRIEDVNFLTKRLREYRRFQKAGGLSMH